MFLVVAMSSFVTLLQENGRAIKERTTGETLAEAGCKARSDKPRQRRARTKETVLDEIQNKVEYRLAVGTSGLSAFCLPSLPPASHHKKVILPSYAAYSNQFDFQVRSILSKTNETVKRRQWNRQTFY